MEVDGCVYTCNGFIIFLTNSKPVFSSTINGGLGESLLSVVPHLPVSTKVARRYIRSRKEMSVPSSCNSVTKLTSWYSRNKLTPFESNLHFIVLW